LAISRLRIIISAADGASVGIDEGAISGVACCCELRVVVICVGAGAVAGLVTPVDVLVDPSPASGRGVVDIIGGAVGLWRVSCVPPPS